MASKCRKFVPNMFNKSKCQACFGAKELHSAEALESNKATRKVSKCGYLFVSPDLDFSNPLDRTRKWQRRFFRLYDDGELTFSVDENPDTVPQGSVDMNRCTDVLEAEALTTHSNSIAVVTPEKTEYFKATSKEEMQWWHDVLIEFPNNLKSIKPRRKPNLISNKENVQPVQDGYTSKEVVKSNLEIDRVRQQPAHGSDLPAYATFKGVRSLKHKYDKNHQEGMRKSSSLHDLTSQEKEMASTLASSRFLSCSGDRLDVLSSCRSVDGKQVGALSVSPYFNIPRTSWPSRVHPSNPMLTAPAAHPSLFNSSSSLSSTSSTSSAAHRGLLEDRAAGQMFGTGSKERSRPTRERSASLKDLSTHFTLARDTGSLERGPGSVSSGGLRADGDDLSQSMSADETDGNETDELKMARSSELSATSRAQSHSGSCASDASPTKYEDLVYMKKGWLVKQGPSEKESRKHWFVLAGNSLRYFQDAKAEETNALDGRIDLSSCHEVSEVNMARYYGFKIKNKNGEYILAAMTSGIRNNWMKAIRLCMDLHSSRPKLNLSCTLTGKALAGLSARTVDDFDVGSGSHRNSTCTLPTTAVVTGSKGETAFQLVAQQESSKKEQGVRNVRRHHSDVNPMNVGKILSIKEISTNIDTADPALSSCNSSVGPTHPTISASQSSMDLTEKPESVPRGSKIPRHHSSLADAGMWSQAGGPLMNRYVEGSDSIAINPSSQVVESRRSKRNITGESSREEEKREMLHRAKSPSARVKEKSRGAKTPRLHSPPPEDDDFDYHSGQRAGGSASETSQILSDTEDDLDIMVSSEEHYTDTDGGLDQDSNHGGHDKDLGDGILVEMLESEVRSLKERLDKTQSQLVKMQETNVGLKSRLHKGSSQSLDTSFGSSRWNQQSGQQMEPSQVQTMKRQLKEAKDTVQKQRMEIEGLKAKLDMSVSKLTGTEKALSEALREYKQEKDKFMKLSSEWNRRIRSMESQMKENVHKLEKNRESLQSKERECRKLETDMRNQQQKTREQDREILKLKAVEHDYNHLKEQLDHRERELQTAHAELREKDSQHDKLTVEFKQRMSEMQEEFGRERDDLESHVEELKEKLHSYQRRHSTLQDNLTTNMADLIDEKDDIIAQLEEKLIENDHKMEDVSEELQTEMSKNSDLVHSIKVLQEEKQKLQTQISTMERQLLSLRDKVATFEKDNAILRQHLDHLKDENVKLAAYLGDSSTSLTSSEANEPEIEDLRKTVMELNKQIQGLQLKLIEDIDQKKSSAEDEDLLHVILIFDSDLQEVNSLLMNLHKHFDAYLAKVPSNLKNEASALAEMVDEVGHRCLVMQDTLRDSSQGQLWLVAGDDYHHDITVDVSSGSQEILDEYHGLKGKFDRAVAELKKLKKEVNEVYHSYDELENRDKQLKKDILHMETSYREQVENLVRRVDQLSSQLANANSTAALQAKLEASSHQPTSTSMSTEIEKQLSQLDKKITFMEKALAGKSPSSPQAAKSRPSLSPQDTQSIMSRLKDMKEQLESTNSGLKEILSDVVSSQVDDFQEASQQQILTSCIDGCGKKIEKLTDMIRGERGGECGSASKNPGGCCGGGGCPDSKDGGGSSGMTQSMQEIKERIQEIGELLDCLDDDAEDSDEEEGETTTVDDVRERLANLCEYVEQHCTFSNYDWHLMQLLTVQKTEASKMRPQQTGGGDGGTDSKDKLQDYVDRLSLEALILVEMAHLLEDKGAQSQVEKEEEGDSVLKVLGVLSSRLLSLHRKLDQECKTLHMEDATSDVLAVQADLIAEKILLEGELSSGTFGQNLQPNEEKDKKVQPKLLATEAIMRTQLDSYIGKNLDKTCEELWSSASHLTLRCLVQGELTFALNCLKKRLSDRVHESKPEGLRDLFFKRLKQRHKLVMDVAEVYENKIIKALAIIVSKESEEMTIVEGPENVLDTVCSEVSTIMEKHIQKYKEKIRSAEDTQSAHQWDMVVNQLRTDRESVLTGIREQHATISPESDGEDNIEVPFQTLDSTINNFGEILSLKSVLSAQIHFIDELLKVGDATLLDDVDFDVEEEEVEECGAEEEVVVQWTLQKGLTSFMQKLTDCLKMEATSRRDQVARLVPSSTRKPSDIVAEIPDVTNLKGDTQYSEGLTREAVFAAQLTFMMCKMKLQHEQELDRLRASRPSRAQQSSSVEGREDGESDLDSLLGPLEDVLDTKYDDEMETLRVVASQVSKLRSAVQGSGSTQNWAQVDEQVQNLEQKLQEELNLAQQRHEAHLDLFKQEEAKVEQAWENVQQEREILEDRCTALETELQSITSQHDDEVERMRQDVLTAVSAIRANEEESEIHLSDQVQRLTKQMLIQKENFQRFLNKAKDCLSEDGKSHESLKQLVEQELKTVSETQLVDVEHSDDEESPPLPSQPPPSLVQRDDKSLKMEEELELLKKEKDEALAEETRNTKAALDAMKKAYEEELQQERDKYKEILTTMYNEDFVNEIRRRYETEVEKSREELKQVKMHYLSKCEDYKLLEIKMGQTKQDYESHINQLIMSNAHLDDMVNQEIDRLKDFIKNRPANLTTGSATLEEELYDAQIMTRVKDAELQKLRSQAKNLENSLHRTTEEHRQTMTQYLQALKENQELRKEYQMETAALRDQLDKLQGESGQRRPIRRAPSFHHRARSPSPQSSASQCKESASSTTEHISRDSNRRRRLDQRDLRRSKSSPSLPYVFDAKGMPTAVKGTSKGGRSVQSKS